MAKAVWPKFQQTYDTSKEMTLSKTKRPVFASKPGKRSPLPEGPEAAGIQLVQTWEPSANGPNSRDCLLAVAIGFRSVSLHLFEYINDFRTWECLFLGGPPHKNTLVGCLLVSIHKTKKGKRGTNSAKGAPAPHALGAGFTSAVLRPQPFQVLGRLGGFLVLGWCEGNENWNEPFKGGARKVASDPLPRIERLVG